MPRRAALLAAILGGGLLLAGTLVLLPASAGRGAVAVIALDGTCRLRMVDAERLAQAEAMLADEADRIETMAGRLLSEAAAVRFAVSRERVPAFGDWAYGWVQSYVTSYRVLGRVANELFQSATGAHPADSLQGITDRVAAAMAAPIREEFASQVLAPSTLDGGILVDLAHTGTVIDDAWREALQALDAMLEGPSPGPGDGAAVARFDLVAAALSMAPALEALGPRDPSAVIAEESADATTIFFRSMRPMAARLGTVAVKLSEVGSILAAGSAFGYAFGGLPGLAVGTVGGIGLSWSIDWTFSHLDAALNRSAFEAQALEAIERAELRISERAAAATAGALVLRRAALRSGSGGCG